MNNLALTYEELQAMPLRAVQDLWRGYFKTEPKPIKKSMLRSLWYEIQCKNIGLKLEQKYITRLNRYALDPNRHIEKSHKAKYDLALGSQIIKNYKGQKYVVNIIADNKFEYNRDVYRTLSATAKAICNKKVSGYDFFGLNNKGVNKNVQS
jgi:hypothetical protein